MGCSRGWQLLTAMSPGCAPGFWKPTNQLYTYQRSCVYSIASLVCCKLCVLLHESSLVGVRVLLLPACSLWDVLSHCHARLVGVILLVHVAHVLRVASVANALCILAAERGEQHAVQLTCALAAWWQWEELVVRSFLRTQAGRGEADNAKQEHMRCIVSVCEREGAAVTTS